MLFPVTVTKDKEEAKVYHAPDLHGWLEAGWKVAGEKTTEKKQTAKKEKELDFDLQSPVRRAL